MWEFGSAGVWEEKGRLGEGEKGRRERWPVRHARGAGPFDPFGKLRVNRLRDFVLLRVACNGMREIGDGKVSGPAESIDTDGEEDAEFTGALGEPSVDRADRDVIVPGAVKDPRLLWRHGPA